MVNYNYYGLRLMKVYGTCAPRQGLISEECTPGPTPDYSCTQKQNYMLRLFRLSQSHLDEHPNFCTYIKKIDQTFYSAAGIKVLKFNLLMALSYEIDVTARAVD
jgi:hypothetical protein